MGWRLQSAPPPTDLLRVVSVNFSAQKTVNGKRQLLHAIFLVYYDRSRLILILWFDICGARTDLVLSNDRSTKMQAGGIRPFSCSGTHASWVSRRFTRPAYYQSKFWRDERDHVTVVTEKTGRLTPKIKTRGANHGAN